MFEGKLNSSICSCGLGKLRRPSKVVRTFDGVAHNIERETSVAETADSIRGMVDTAMVFLKPGPSTDRRIEYKNNAQPHHPKAVI